MRNNSQKQYDIRVTILHGEEKNGTQRFIGGSKERRRISGWSTKVKPSGALHQYSNLLMNTTTVVVLQYQIKSHTTIDFIEWLSLASYELELVCDRVLFCKRLDCYPNSERFCKCRQAVAAIQIRNAFGISFRTNPTTVDLLTNQLHT